LCQLSQSYGNGSAIAAGADDDGEPRWEPFYGWTDATSEAEMTQLRTRRLGRTGLLVTELGFGGASVADSPEGEDALLRALSLGINFVETGRCYRGSEHLIGRVLRRLGQNDSGGVHVASKTLRRSRDGALADLETSLRHLGLPKVDIYQLNSLDDQEWEQVMAKGGALEGLKEARGCGLVDYIGISSHKVEVLRRAVESQEFDTIQTKYSVFNTAGESLIRLAEERNIGVIAMKPLGGFGMLGWLKSSPQATSLTARALLRYALSNRHLSVVIPGMRFPWEAEENVAVATSSERMTHAERERLHKRARDFLAEAAGTA
jgi:aryl-alcohol dehydrogenase-like predicted oxidoreductase